MLNNTGFDQWADEYDRSVARSDAAGSYPFAGYQAVSYTQLDVYKRQHQDSVRRGVRRGQLHSASAEAAKAPYPLAPSSFPNCDRCAGSQFGVIWDGQTRLGN